MREDDTQKTDDVNKISSPDLYIPPEPLRVTYTAMGTWDEDHPDPQLAGGRYQYRDALKREEFFAFRDFTDWYASQGARGKKCAHRCPAIIPGELRDKETCTREKKFFVGAALGWADLDGGDICRSRDDLDATIAALASEGIHVAVISSSSHDPDHPTAPSWRLRLWWRWGRVLRAREYEDAALGVLAYIAEAKGMALPRGRDQLRDALRALGLDPQVRDLSTPASVARWGVWASGDEYTTVRRRERSSLYIPPSEAAEAGADPDPWLRRGRRACAVPLPQRGRRGGGTQAPSKEKAGEVYHSPPAPSGSTAVDMAGWLIEITGPLHPGCGESDTGLWRAAIALRRSGVVHTADEAVDIMASAYPRYPRSALIGKARSAWRGGGTQAPSKNLGGLVCHKFFGPIAWETSEGSPVRVILRRGPCGSGKSTRTREEIARVREDGGRVIEISHRRALCRASSRSSGLSSYLDTSGDIAGSAVVCVDSAGRVSIGADGDVQGLDDVGKIDFLIIEESEQVARHIVSEDRIRSGRSGAIWTAMRRIIRAAEKILCLDADCGHLTQTMIAGLLGEMPAHKIERISTLPTPKTAIIAPPGAWGEAGMRIKLRQFIESQHINKKPILLFCTGRKKSREMQKIVLELGVEEKDILLFHGENSVHLPQKALAEDPTRVARYRVVIHTTALGSGIDITTPCHVLAYIDASAGPIADDVLQGISRCRPADKIYVFIYGSPRVGEADSDPAEHRRLLYSRGAASDRVLRALLTDRDPATLSMSVDPALAHLYCIVRAYEAAQSWLPPRYGPPLVDATADHPAIPGDMISEGALARHLQAHGWEVHHGGMASSAADPAAAAAVFEVQASVAQSTEARTAVKTETIDKILSSEILSDDEAAVYRGREIDETTRAALYRYDLRRWYGRDPDEDLITRDQRGWRSQCRGLADLVLCMEGEAIRVAEQDEDRRARGALGGDRTLRAASMKKILALCGITDITCGGVIHPPAIQQEDLIRRIAWEIFSLDKSKKLHFQALIGRLLEKFAIRTRSVHIRTPEGRARVYRIDLEALDMALTDAAAAIDRLRGVSAIAPQPHYEAADIPMIDIDAIMAGLMEAAA
jgi:hypothetical protein